MTDSFDIRNSAFEILPIRRTLIDRVHRELTDADLEKITSTYHAWRGDSSPENLKLKTENSAFTYADVRGFCFSATTEQIASHGHVLTPGRYVGTEEVEDDGEPFEEKMPRLVAESQVNSRNRPSWNPPSTPT